ncbi:copper chaperone PCu(A)C [Kitasatospora purpeofusca]|uniref:Copper chaperone PCu(A)C n=1 Tax=Kitasatospora purpeofusca TaxID=67352 RepID=A0ABZ1U9G7_9ACTN|nr:copper chaperone PCu(A)C [Kitasatospora purpeofusca]
MSGRSAAGGRTAERPKVAERVRVAERLKVVGPPIGAAAVALALLSGWTAVGGAGTARPVEVGPGWLLLPSAGGVPSTAAFFTVRNPGDIPDQLTGASWEFGGKVTLKRHLHQGAAGSWAPVTALEVPERGELAMSPEDADLMIINPPALKVGQWVEFTLTFRNSPDLRVKAEVRPPGGRRS